MQGKSSTTGATRQKIVFQVTLTLGPCSCMSISTSQNNPQKSQRTTQSTDAKLQNGACRMLRERRRLWTTTPRRLSRLRVKTDVTHIGNACSPLSSPSSHNQQSGLTAFTSWLYLYRAQRVPCQRIAFSTLAFKACWKLKASLKLKLVSPLTESRSLLP